MIVTGDFHANVKGDFQVKVTCDSGKRLPHEHFYPASIKVL